MEYQYEILFMKESPGQPANWFATSNPSANLGPNIHAILNQRGHQGWRVAAMGDIALGSHAEIILIRP